MEILANTDKFLYLETYKPIYRSINVVLTCVDVVFLLKHNYRKYLDFPCLQIQNVMPSFLNDEKLLHYKSLFFI